MIFDFAVNAGTGRAAKFIQRLVNTTVDGGIRPNTLGKIKEYVITHGIDETISNYALMRQNYYESLSTFDTFGKGWTRRVEETTQSALGMVEPLYE